MTAAAHGEESRRLAQAVQRRRRQLGLAQGDLTALGGPSEQTVRKIEQGQEGPYRRQTLDGLDRALGWKRGTTRGLLAGAVTGDPQTWLDAPTAVAHNVHCLRPASPVADIAAAQSDIDAVTSVLNRLTRERLTPKREATVRALLDLMPELIAKAAGQ